MEFKDYADLIKEQKILDLKKLSYQLLPAETEELITILHGLLMSPLPLLDAGGKSLTIMLPQIRLQSSRMKTLQTPQAQPIGMEAMSQELYSSMKIENIQTSRESVRQILSGQAPTNASEAAIYQMKLGLDYISDPGNEISASNLITLYQIVFQDQLPEKHQPSKITGFRDDAVYVMGSRLDRPVHTGVPFTQLPDRINGLVRFAQDPGNLDDLTAAAVLHFYLAYLHPWFDGNGRMARLLHLWYLVRQGYPSALYVPFSQYIEESKKHYYRAFLLAEQNQIFLEELDVTPFVVYFSEHVYSRIDLANDTKAVRIFDSVLNEGKVTVKEKDLWAFVISAYGTREFSTKQLEKDFGNAAYQTIYKFVHKFESIGLLTAQRYGNRVRYRISG